MYKSTIEDIITQSNRMTAKTIYVPTKLREHVTTKSTTSGTRLQSKLNNY